MEKKRLTAEEKIAALQERIRGIQAREKEKLRKVKVRESIQNRRLRTRQAVIVGASLIDLAMSNDAARKVLASILTNLQRDQDKETLAPLVAALKADKAQKAEETKK